MKKENEKSYRSKITIEIDKDLYRLIKMTSASNGVTIRSLIEKALLEVFAKK